MRLRDAPSTTVTVEKYCFNLPLYTSRYHVKPPIHLLRYGVCAGTDSGRYRIYRYQEAVIVPMSVYGSYTCKRVEVMVMVVGGPRFPLCFLDSDVFEHKRTVQVKELWMHDQGREKRSSFLFHMRGRLGNIPTHAAISWNRWFNMLRCLLQLLLLTCGCFLIMYPCSNSNARQRPRSKAFGDPWETCMPCMPMRAP